MSLIQGLRNKVLDFKTRYRNFYWSMFLKNFGKGSNVFGEVVIHRPINVSIGNHTILNDGVILNARGPINIGNNVHVSARAMILTTGLEYERFGKDRTHFIKEVVIEDGVWIGAGAIIGPGVRIGENAVVGAASFVNKDVLPNTVVGGVPAKLIRHLNLELKKENIRV